MVSNQSDRAAVTLDFQLAAFLTGIVLFAAASLAYVTTRDTLHP